MLWLLLVSAAWARPAEVAPVVPTSVDVGVQADVLGGVDAWEGGGGPSSELRLRAGGQHRRGPRSMSGGYGGHLQIGTGAWALDHHYAWADLRARGPLGVEATLSGSFVQGWGELMLAPDLRLGRGRTTAQVTAGGVLRSDGHTLPGAGLNAWGSHRLHPRWSVGAWLQARAWADPYLPHTAAAGLAATWNPRFDLEIRSHVGVAHTLAGEQPARAGLLPAGGAMWRSDVEVGWSVSNTLALLASGGWEGGRAGVGWSRWRAFVGLRAHLGRTRATAPDLGPLNVRLTVSAPEASRVEVVGDFTEWRPLLLEPTDDGWVLELRLTPGVYEYVYLIDGRTEVPPEADAHRDDGFGGQNGLLYVGARGA